MLINSVLKSAQPYLQGSRVRDVVVGISLIAVELDSGLSGFRTFCERGWGPAVLFFLTCGIWREQIPPLLQNGPSQAPTICSELLA